MFKSPLTVKSSFRDINERQGSVLVHCFMREQVLKINDGAGISSVAFVTGSNS